MKYIKLFHTCITVGGAWWKWHVWISFVVDPYIRVVVQCYHVLMPLEEELIVIGGWDPTTS
jgi:hypothetical protein